MWSEKKNYIVKVKGRKDPGTISEGMVRADNPKIIVCHIWGLQIDIFNVIKTIECILPVR